MKRILAIVLTLSLLLAAGVCFAEEAEPVTVRLGVTGAFYEDL